MVRSPPKENNLLTRFPLVAGEWHSSRNYLLKPEDFFPFSGIKVWWKCHNGHSYEARIANRTLKKSGCPYCAGKKVTKENSFFILHPEKVTEWDYEKNHPLVPEDYAQYSGKKVWWKCKKNHEWKARIADRSQGNNCPFCWKHTSIPEFRLIAELEYIFGSVVRRSKFSGSEVDIYIDRYQIGIEYDGAYWHKGKESRDKKKEELLSFLGIILIRVREEPLEIISERDVLTSQRGLKKNVINEILMEMRTFCNNEDKLKVDKYVSQKTFQNEDAFKKYQTDLPKPEFGNSLAIGNKRLVKEFDYEKNHPLTPEHCSRGSQEKVWWKFYKGHSWEAIILNRTLGNAGCPFCSHNLVSEDSNLESKYPNIAKLWHPTKNGDLQPSDVFSMSNLKRWWKCENGHEWELTVSSITRNNSGCPSCKLQSRSIKVKFPHLIKEWDFEENSGIDPINVTYGSKKKYSWICSKGHSWEATVNSRTTGSNCPFCKKFKS